MNNETKPFVVNENLIITECLKLWLEQNYPDDKDKERLEQVMMGIQDEIEYYLNNYRNGLKTNKPEEVMMAFNELLDGIEIKDEVRKEIRCTKGCTHCCKINVDMSDLEGALIVDYLRFTRRTVDKEYLERQKDLTNHERSQHPDKDCVFLDKVEGLCTIYPVRPVACRKYFVGTDPALCNATTNFFGKVGVLAIPEMEVIASAIANTDVDVRSNANRHMAAVLLKLLKEQS